MERSIIEIASRAGPLLAFEVDKGRLPHAVPRVPAPKLEPTARDAEEVVEGDIVEGVTLATAEVGVELIMFVVEIWEKAEEAEANTLGQNVLLHD